MIDRIVQIRDYAYGDYSIMALTDFGKLWVYSEKNKKWEKFIDPFFDSKNVQD